MLIIIGLKGTHILLDLGCLVYKIINSRFIRRTGFKCINIPARKLINIGKKESYINEIVKVEIDINKY